MGERGCCMTMMADLKLLLEVTDSSYDSLLTLMLDATKEKADRYMGLRHFDVVTNQLQRFDGYRSIFALDHANAAVISMIIAAGTDEELVEDTAYVVNQKRGVVRMRTGELEAGKYSVEITYNGGYQEANVPKDLQFAVIKQSAYEFRRRKDMGIKAVGMPDGSLEKMEIDEWLPDVLKVLNGYRRILI
jgi:hypothetical protein